MKKFLSLLLALVMTMSLVTISAGATEYKDLTDKDELGPQYQEAVAVLNKIGVITGYDDGSFRPDVELTRGAAAKIIVSLLIGPEAANNLPNNRAPYPDVPANHTFAGVIAYCQTAGIINGYGDGTFKPANDLTGYAFAKMLLSALGYDNTIEKFVDTGWTMNVLNVGQAAGLFDRLDFKGSEAVTRKDAALLALNTLKATVVEYKNGQNITVTGENTNVTVSTDATAEYKTSNQDFARNILPQRRNAQQNQGSDWFTVEFAEEHFIDLRLPHDKYSPTDDNFGRPSAEWTYKKLSIGTFPLVPDYEYTTQVIHNVNTVTDGAKVRALGLNGYSVEQGTNRTHLWINGVDCGTFNGQTITLPDGENFALDNVADIANFTDNGTLVQVYVDNNGADFITDVVVIRTQLMEVRRVGSDYVSLDVYDDHSDANGKVLYGYNYIPVDEKVNNVEAEDDCYTFLSGLKAGDKVAVVPVAVGHSANSYDVAEAYTPETVTGALTGAESYGNVGTDRNAINLTVGGTKYNISLWNKDMREIDSDSVKVTKKDVTLTLDKYGNALLASDVGATSNWMVVGNYRQGLVNGIVVTYANGWDIKGNEVSLNIGYQHDTTGGNKAEQDFPVGSLVYYTNDTNSNTAEWKLSKTGIYNVSDVAANGTDKYEIKTSSSRLLLKNDVYGNAVPAEYKMPFYVNNVPFIYVTMDKSGEIDSIEIKKNPQSVTNDEILGDAKFGFVRNAEAAISIDKKTGNMKDPDDAGIEAVVVKKESSAVSINNLLYISNYHGSVQKDANGNMVQGYEVAMLGTGGKLVEKNKVIYSDRTNLKIGTFARYTEATRDGFEDFYTLRPFSADNAFDTAGDSVAILKTYIAKTGADNAFVGANSRMVYLDGNYSQTTRTSGVYSIEKFQPKADTNLVAELYGNNDAVANLVNVRRAEWLDLTSYKQDIESPSELKDAYSDVTAPHTKAGWHRDIQVTLLFNDNPDSDEFRQVYMVVVNYITPGDVANTAGGGSEVVTGDIVVKPDKAGTADGGKITYNGDGTINIGTVVLTAPDWAYVSGTVGTDLGSATAVKWNLTKGDTKWFGADKDAKATYDAEDKYNLDLTNDGALSATDIASFEKGIKEGYKITLTVVPWKEAKVVITLDGKTVESTTKSVTVDTTESIAIPAIPGATTETADYTLTGVSEDTTKTGTLANALNLANTISSVKAVGKAPVTVALTASASLPLVFAIDQNATTGLAVAGVAIGTNFITAGDGKDETGELKFSIDGTNTSETITLASGAKSGTAHLTVSLNTISEPTVESYTVKVTVADGKVLTYTLKAGAMSDMQSFPISEGFTLARSAVKVTANVKATTIVTTGEGAPTKATGTNFDTLTVTLKGVTSITKNDVFAKDSSGVQIEALNVDNLGNGKFVIYFAKNALDAGSKVAINGSNEVVVSALADADAGITLMAAVSAEDVADLGWKNSDVIFYLVIGDGSVESAETTTWAAVKDQFPVEEEVEATDAEKVAAAKAAIEALTLSFDKVKDTASTTAAIKSAVQAEIIAAAAEAGVTVDADDITITLTDDATDPADAETAGTDGKFGVSVALTLNDATDTAALANQVINAPAFA